jgi:fructose-1,6-bisphosphatase/inositol monophosphatase family enzyme
VAVTKANSKDLLTLTDSACQRRIQSVLQERLPSSRFLGEEDVAPGAKAAAEAAEVLLTKDDQVRLSAGYF